ncbi:hypothetical protein AB5I41_12485 [Sphingomonas sp. MMS24-JH45]
MSFLDAKGASAGVGPSASRTTGSAAATRHAVRRASSRSPIAGAAGLGDALPAGVVRVYVRDARRGQLRQFAGEDPHRAHAQGSTIALPTGDAFDVKVQPTAVDVPRLSGDRWRTRMRYRLTNARSRAATVAGAGRAGASTPAWSRRAASNGRTPARRCGRCRSPPTGRPWSPPPSTRATGLASASPRAPAGGRRACDRAAAPRADRAPQQVVTSAAPQRIAATVYRAPYSRHGPALPRRLRAGDRNAARRLAARCRHTAVRRRDGRHRPPSAR